MTVVASHVSSYSGKVCQEFSFSEICCSV